ASIIKLIKPNIRYITGFITISYIYFTVPIRYTIKGTYKEARPGRLKPNILLYSEPYLDNKEILETTKYNLRIYPELVLIISIKLRISSA
ncbi:uncharacterized protein K444DRAFT_545048, partial [Hyaloscypha bicolor E]